MRFLTLIVTVGFYLTLQSPLAPPPPRPPILLQLPTQWCTAGLAGVEDGVFTTARRPGSMRWGLSTTVSQGPGVVRDWKLEQPRKEEDSGDTQPWGTVSTQRRNQCFP